MNPTKLCNPQAYPLKKPWKPLNEFRTWLAEENYRLVHWVKIGILRSVPTLKCYEDELVGFLEDAYLRSVQLYDPWAIQECKDGKRRRVQFQTFATASMRMSGYRNWIKWVNTSIENTTHSLDYRSDSDGREHVEPVLWEALGIEEDYTDSLRWEELVQQITHIVGPTDCELFVRHVVLGINLANLGIEQGYSRERARQVMARITNAIRRALGVGRFCKRCQKAIAGVRCPCTRRKKVCKRCKQVIPKERQRCKCICNGRHKAKPIEPKAYSRPAKKHTETDARIAVYTARAEVGLDLFAEVQR